MIITLTLSACAGPSASTDEAEKEEQPVVSEEEVTSETEEMAPEVETNGGNGSTVEAGRETLWNKEKDRALSQELYGWEMDQGIQMTPYTPEE